MRGVTICRQSDQAQQPFEVMSQQIVKAERQCFPDWTDSPSMMKSMCLAVRHLRAERKRNKRREEEGKSKGKDEEPFRRDYSEFS